MTGIFPEDGGIIKGINSFFKYALTHWQSVGGLNFIMIFLAIFSKEKVEDEMTTAIRLNTLYSSYLESIFFYICLAKKCTTISSASKISLWKTSAYWR